MQQEFTPMLLTLPGLMATAGRSDFVRTCTMQANTCCFTGLSDGKHGAGCAYEVVLSSKVQNNVFLTVIVSGCHAPTYRALVSECECV